MSIEQELIQYLIHELYNIAWVYPNVFPDDVTFPAVKVQRISGRPIVTHTHSQGERARFQVSSFAHTYEGAKSLSNALKSALSGTTGALGDDFDARCLVVNETDLYEPDTRLHHVALDVDIIATTP
jgi:hypothetical protein